MKIVYVQTYPVYHEAGGEQEWLALSNRDKWMPALTAGAGHQVELWAAGSRALDTTIGFDDMPGVPVRIFPADPGGARSKHHTSRALSEAARQAGAGLFVLKGMDGGVGVHLARSALIPGGRPYAVVIGGEVWHPIARHARWILYETAAQTRLLARPGYRFWRGAVSPERLVHLPKSVDTKVFRPLDEQEKPYDIIGMGRLIGYYKSYEALRRLARSHRVAVLGGGPMLERFRRECPEIHWLGPVAHNRVPQYLAQARLFFHSGLRDWFPRAVAEAAACGVPPVGFAEAIGEDVIPEKIGLRVTRKNYKEPVARLLDDPGCLEAKARAAREHAERYWHKRSCTEAIRRMTCEGEVVHGA